MDFVSYISPSYYRKVKFIGCFKKNRQQFTIHPMWWARSQIDVIVPLTEKAMSWKHFTWTGVPLLTWNKAREWLVLATKWCATPRDLIVIESVVLSFLGQGNISEGVEVWELRLYDSGIPALLTSTLLVLVLREAMRLGPEWDLMCLP